MKNIKELCEISINCTCEKEETSAGLFRSWVLHQQEYIRLDLDLGFNTEIELKYSGSLERVVL